MTEQPMPVDNGGQVVIDHVFEYMPSDFMEALERDLRARAEIGKVRYGTYLMTNNGRSALQDWYDELLDGIMYCKQKQMEEGHTIHTDVMFWSLCAMASRVKIWIQAEG